MNNQVGVKQKIIEVAKQEFLKYGFKDASLRNISAAACVTTGAIYTHFKDKNALFEAIVDPICDEVEVIFQEISASYYDSNTIISDVTLQKSLDDFNVIYTFIYKNLDVFRLLVVGSDGSSRANFVHTIVEKEVKHTLAYLESMLKNNYIKHTRIDATIVHTISESYINSILEPVRHNMSHKDALKNLKALVIFYTGGWQSIFNEMLNK